jgi:2-desacetyl-2-hydroxyethyl bacteriochlorophyllide A dehydrogenase
MAPVQDPTVMRAALARTLPADHLDIALVPKPRIEHDDDVLVRVEACGICGTDLHILDGISYRPDVPFVLGHEPVGIVVEAGATARAWLGQRVTMTLFTGDGSCPVCLEGDQRLCPNLVSITGVLAAWGGYAELLRVHAQQLIAVPGSVPAEEAASLVDCGATAANSVRVALERRPGRVLVLGAGPIGYMCAELLRIADVSVQVVQHSALRREALARIGHDVVASMSQASAPVDVVIDCTGSADVLAPGLQALGPQGCYILAGYARVPDVDLAVVARKELTIRGIRSGRREDLERCLQLTADGHMRLPEISRWPLQDVNAALVALRERRVPGKAVIVPDGDPGDRAA